MEDLSNTAIIGSFISMLVATVGGIWGMYKHSESQRNKERVDAMNQIINTTNESKKANVEALEKQIKYQQELIDSYKTDLDELQKKYFELASTLHPALHATNKTLEDIGVIITNLISK